MIEAIKKMYPINDESGNPSTYPTMASQVFFNDGTVLEGKKFGGGGSAEIDWGLIYPKGSIYMSLEDVCAPAALIAGSVWERITDRFLLGASDPDGTVTYAAGAEDGDKTHTHGLSNAVALFTSSGGNPIFQYKACDPWTSNWIFSGVTGGTEEKMLNDATTIAGNTDAVSHLPPYLAVYMWKRVS